MINSYHIKVNYSDTIMIYMDKREITRIRKQNWLYLPFIFQMEDECSIGNDETRIFILSSYASNKMNRVPCVLCKTMLHIFDRYPLLDGTFFLSPKQHNKSCIQVS